MSDFAERFSSTYSLLPAVLRSTGRDLLGIPFGQLRGNRCQVAEQASRAVVRSGGEVHLSGRRGGGIVIRGGEVSWAECPDAIDGQGLAAGVLYKAVKFSGG